MFATGPRSAAAPAWDDGLDDAQLQAATHGDGPLVILAGAGTGKTRTLTSRVACLLERGVPPQRILLLTFTRRAAEEMLARAAALASNRDAERPRGGTFHAVAHQQIAAYADLLGLPGGVGVLDPAGSCDLMDLVRGDHDLNGTEARFPRTPTLVDIYSRCINNERPLRELVPAEYPWCEPHLEAIAGLFRDYTARKRAAGLLDFDDLLLSWRALLRHPALGPDLAARVSHVLVDEYQDLNVLQVGIVELLAPGGRGLTVVGDEAQAIYGFRGSDPVHLRRVVESFEGATVIRLERNFRSRQAVLDTANVLRPGEEQIALEAVRGTGTKPLLRRCYDAGSEARAVADRILEAHERGVPLRHQAVLVRAGHHSDLVEVELSVRRVPYRKYGGLRFLEAAHVKDFVAAGRLLDNPADDVAWYRVLRLHRGVGPARARSLLDHVHHHTTESLVAWPELVALAPPLCRGELSQSLPGLAAAAGCRRPGERAEQVLQALRPLVVEHYDDAPARLTDLERLVGAASATDDFAAFLAQLTLDPPASTGDLAADPHLDVDYVVISTIHSAKGLEWPIVHLPHLVDGAVPSDMALKSAGGLEEEQRLLYVAVTRARDELFLYAPLRMPHHRRALDDRHSFAPISRFLDDEAVEATLSIEDERRGAAGGATPGGAVASQRHGLAAGSTDVDLDPLWA